jgi:hypothetical protein
LAAALARASSDRVTEHVLEALPGFGTAAEAAAPAVLDAAKRLLDPFLRFEAAETLLRLHSPAGLVVLRDLLAQNPPLLLEQKVGQTLVQMTGQDFGLGQAGTADEKGKSRASFANWLARKDERLRWRPDLQRFE